MQALLAGKMRDAFDACADAAAIGFCADGFDFDPIVAGARIAAQKLGKIVDGVDDDVEVAVIVKVAEGAAARGDRHRDTGARVVGSIVEAPVAQILVQQLALRVARFGFQLLDFRINMSIAEEDVRPAVIVHVEKAAAPAEILRMLAEAALVGAVLEIRAAKIVVERGRVASKICFDEIEIAVEIVIGGGDAHAGLGLAVGAESAARFQGDVYEGAVLFVLIQRAGGGVVGNVNVRPAIVVEISGEHAEAESAVSLEDAGFFADVGEGSVAVVVIENVLAAVESRRAAGDHDAFVEAGTGFGNRRGLQVEIDVVGDEKIEVAVAIVVHESAAGVPALAVSGDAGFFADVCEGAVTVVVVENVFSEVGNEEIVEAVVVVIADANGLPPAGMEQAGFSGDVRESSVAIVFEEMRSGFLSGRETFEAPAVDKKNVQPAVVVVIVESDAAAGGFEKILVLVLAAVNGFGVQAGFARDVKEGNAKIVRVSRTSGLLRSCSPRKGFRHPLFRERQGEHLLEREHDRGAAERLEKCAASGGQKNRYLSLRASC